MSTNLDSAEVLAVKKVFDRDAKYLIPLYQRAYAWGDDEIDLLLQDVVDAFKRTLAKESSITSDYFLGTIVVYKHHGLSSGCECLEVVDGQQRLTTLYLILSYLANSHAYEMTIKAIYDVLDPDDISFECRESSTMMMHLIHAGTPQPSERENSSASGIYNGYLTVTRSIDKIKSELGTSFNGFVDYLLNRTCIVRVELPTKTDLNHYFEVMNTRGEQLEKHEVVKARFMNLIDSTTERETFAKIWDAASNMGSYCQMAFTTHQRDKIFGDRWIDAPPLNFEAIVNGLQEDTSGSDEHEPTSVCSIIERLNQGDNPQFGTAEDAEDGEDLARYHAVLDFPNFLLQVLKLYYAKRLQEGTTADISGDGSGTPKMSDEVSLDDKRLIEAFDSFLKNHGSKTAAKDFSAFLLTTRYLFDTYIIKTMPSNATLDYANTDEESDDTAWILRRFRKRNESNAAQSGDRATFEDDELQRDILTIESMYQVTETRRPYKNFVQAILSTLWDEGMAASDGKRLGAVDGHDLLNAIQKHAAQELADMLAPTVGDVRDQVKAVLDDGGFSIQRFVFNFTDYLLWYFFKTPADAKPKSFLDNDGGAIREKAKTILSLIKIGDDGLVKDGLGGYRFRYKTSVEHFSPQHPVGNVEQAEGVGDHKLSEGLNSFANLCLMTRRENSARGNLWPAEKVHHYLSNSTGAQTIKFLVMASIEQREGAWNEGQVDKSEKQLVDLLANVINWEKMNRSCEKGEDHI